jgi:hypothetical protein
MRQEVFNIYIFEELAEEVQQKLIDRYRYVAVEYNDWYDYILDEIERQGGNLIEFDVDRGTIRIDLEESPIRFANNVVNHHGSDYDTYKISQQYLDGKLSDKDYLHAISQEYLSMLREEFEYLTSDEYVREALLHLEHEYLEDGKTYHT